MTQNQNTNTKTKIVLRNFTGKQFFIEVDLEDTVGDLKRQVSLATSPRRASFTAIEPTLKFNGHELRKHRKLAFYGIKEKSTVFMAPPRKPDEVVKLKFVASGKPFTMEVPKSITVNELKQDLMTEESVPVQSLSYSAAEPNAPPAYDEEDWDVITPETFHDMSPEAALHSFPLSSPEFTIHVNPPPPPVNPPSTFPITVALYDDGTEKKVPFDARLQMTLNDLRTGVKDKCGADIGQDVLILVGKELKREECEDMPLWDLGFAPGCTVHCVPYISFSVQGPDGTTFPEMLMHPLTKLSEIRRLLEEYQQQHNEEDKIPLECFVFTLDGLENLKEWRTLWGLGAFSGCTIYLRQRTITLTITSLSSESFQLEFDELDTIADVKKEFAVLSGIPLGFQLFHRYKLLQDNLTIKDEGLVGGEALRCVPRPTASAGAGSSGSSRWMEDEIPQQSDEPGIELETYNRAKDNQVQNEENAEDL